VSAAARSLDWRDVLVRLEAGPPLTWNGKVVEAAEAGPLCTQRPDALTVWAPPGGWWRAFGLVAMFKSAAPEACPVLTGELPPLELVPYDGRVAAADRQRQGPVQAGTAAYACADLRSDRIFRLLLAGRVRRQPQLEPLLRLHLLAKTEHGCRLLERWSDVVPVLFAGGLGGMMPEGLRTDLEELRDAARRAEHAITGGFHALDRLVRRPSEWEAGARTYLRLAAAQSPTALAVVDRWLDSAAGWGQAPPSVQEGRRLTAARVLHRLVDDPWLAEHDIAGLLAGDMVR
jgi:hypothetical protein